MFFKTKSYSLAEPSRSTKTTEETLYCSTEKKPHDSSNEISEAKPIVKHSPFLAIIYSFITSFAFTITAAMMKKLDYIDVGQLSSIRNSGVFAGSLPILVYFVKDILGPKEYRSLLIIRGFIGATGLYLNLIACRYLPLAEAAVIISVSPAVTTILARIVLKEPCGLSQIISIVLNIVGVLVSVRLPDLLGQSSATKFDYSYLGGLAAAVGSVLTLAFTFVALRKMKDMHFSIPMMYVGFIGMLENAGISSSLSTFVSPNCGWDQIMYVFLIPLGFVTNYMLALSLQVETAGIVCVLMMSMDIIISIIFQLIFFNENLDVYNITGTCLVLASVGMMGIRNWLQVLPEESKSRKRLKYFLL